MPLYLYAYNQASQSGRDLAAGLGINRIKHENSRFRGGPNKTIINWGASSLPQATHGSVIINRPNLVERASHKLNTFTVLRASGVTIPPVTTSGNEAISWLERGDVVIARRLLRASSGRGLTVVDPGEELPAAPLYTKYIKKRDEYRIHIFNDEVIDTQRKGLKEEFARDNDVNWRVRNLANGFVFVRNDGHVIPPNVIEQARMAVHALGLDFGAVDVVYNATQNMAYVLEVNTAPGLMGTTLQNYINAFNEIR